jgi:hypothetical protein
MAAVRTGISNNIDVGGKNQRVAEINNGLITLNTTLEVKDNKINANKARQAIVAVAKTLVNG